MTNLHLTLTPFKNESRLLKECESLISSTIFKEVGIVALWEPGVERAETTRSGVNVTRLKLLTRELPSNLFFQCLKYVEFLFQILLYLRRSNVSVITCHALALLPLGVIVSKLCRAKLVYDAHELETERNGLTGIRKKLSKYIEKKLIPFASLVIVVGDKIADHYEQQYAMQRPTVVLNTPVDQVLDKTDKLREQLDIPEEKKIFLYQGMLTFGRGIDLILEAFSFPEVAKENVVVMLGYGSLKEKIIKASKQHESIYFLDAVSPDEVLEYTVSADYGLCLIEPLCLSYEYCLPNKLFEFLLARVPVISSNLSEMRQVVEKTSAGILLTEFSKKELVNIILAISSFHYAPQKLAEYTWQNQERIMLNSYRKMLAC